MTTTESGQASTNNPETDRFLSFPVTPRNFEEYKELTKMINRQRAAMYDVAKQILTEAFQDLMRREPELLSVEWKQYAPYFNDGDPCEFGIQDISIDYDEAKGDYTRVYQEARDILHTFGQDHLEGLFDTDARIVITPEEIRVESYRDHE